MRFIRGCIVLLFLSATPVLNADVTIRYKTDFKMGPALPASVQQQVSASPKGPFPPVITIQIKGDKGYSNAGITASLLDFARGQVTLIDPTHKLFATVYMKDFPGEIGAAIPTMPAIPPAAQKILDSIKSSFSLRKTGRSEVIWGVQSEETELTTTIEMPVPADLPLPPGIFKPGEIVTVMKIVTQIWNATPSETLRVPALREFGARMSSSQLLNPGGLMQQMLGRLPGFGQAYAPMLDYFAKNSSPTLKSHTAIYMPVMARLAQLVQAQSQRPPANFDADAPLVETNTEASEISDASLDDSIFEVPADYHATNLADLIKTLMPGASIPKQPDTKLPGAP